MLPFRTVNLRLHAGTDITAENPQLRTFTQQYDIHEQSGIPFFRDIIIHELREIYVRCYGQAVHIDSKAAVFSCVLSVLLRISGIGRADVDDRSEGGSFRRSLLFLLDTGKCFIFGGL